MQAFQSDAQAACQEMTTRTQQIFVSRILLQEYPFQLLSSLLLDIHIIL